MTARVRVVIVGLLVTLAASLGWGTALAVQGSRVAAPPAPMAATEPTNPTASVDALFHALTPCRLFDTRIAGGKLASKTTRNFYVKSTLGFPSQGGKSGGCGVPEEAIAITGSLSATDGDNPGYVRAYPVGTTEPTATVLNYLRGPSIGTGLTLSMGKAIGTDLTLKNYGGPVHLVFDVTGYMTQQLQAVVGPNDIRSGNDHILKSEKFGAGAYYVTFDKSIENCAVLASPISSTDIVRAFVSAPTQVSVFVNSTIQANGVDDYVNLVVLC